MSKNIFFVVLVTFFSSVLCSTDEPPIYQVKNGEGYVLFKAEELQSFSRLRGFDRKYEMQRAGLDLSALQYLVNIMRFFSSWSEHAQTVEQEVLLQGLIDQNLTPESINREAGVHVTLASLMNVMQAVGYNDPFLRRIILTQIAHSIHTHQLQLADELEGAQGPEIIDGAGELVAIYQSLFGGNA
jgi:hypothetical protein